MAQNRVASCRRSLKLKRVYSTVPRLADLFPVARRRRPLGRRSVAGPGDGGRGQRRGRLGKATSTRRSWSLALAPLDHAGRSRPTGCRGPSTGWRRKRSTCRLCRGRRRAARSGTCPGSSLTSAQGSALQADVLYRGFGASPLLGANQGLSVYEDGVRVNEVFGDVVAWDLVPTFAAERVELMPGANPMFGLNTLGGAIALNTGSGFDAERLNLTLEAGSFGRRAGELSAGGVFGSAENLGWFVGARSFEEDGWRDFSPSSLRQGLAKFSQRGEGGHMELTLGVAENELIGNGVVPVETARTRPCRGVHAPRPHTQRPVLPAAADRPAVRLGPRTRSAGLSSAATTSTRTTRMRSRATTMTTITTRS